MGCDELKKDRLSHPGHVWTDTRSTHREGWWTGRERTVEEQAGSPEVNPDLGVRKFWGVTRHRKGVIHPLEVLTTKGQGLR